MKGGAPATSLARLTPNEAETTRDVWSLYQLRGNVCGNAGHDALSRQAYQPHPVLIQFRYGCGTRWTRYSPLLTIDGVRVNSISTGTPRAGLHTPSQQYGEVAVLAVDLVSRRRPSEPICL
jgi:hypothetical protein